MQLIKAKLLVNSDGTEKEFDQILRCKVRKSSLINALRKNTQKIY